MARFVAAARVRYYFASRAMPLKRRSVGLRRMDYAEFEEAIKHFASRASDAARRAFALETLELMLPAADAASQRENAPSERALFEAITGGLLTSDPDELKKSLTLLSDEMSADDVRAIEFDGDLVEYLCAVDHWIAYLTTRDPLEICGLAINRVNCIDFRLDEGTDDYSIGNMLGASEMAAEFQRIQARLAGN